eukprot:Hpha_TRINITY_DN16394_c1_g2::TRINITY_DN16394_c1_g2_i1::g.58897::m.58897
MRRENQGREKNAQKGQEIYDEMLYARNRREIGREEYEMDEGQGKTQMHQSAMNAPHFPYCRSDPIPPSPPARAISPTNSCAFLSPGPFSSVLVTRHHLRSTPKALLRLHVVLCVFIFIFFVGLSVHPSRLALSAPTPPLSSFLRCYRRRCFLPIFPSFLLFFPNTPAPLPFSLPPPPPPTTTRFSFRGGGKGVQG